MCAYGAPYIRAALLEDAVLLHFASKKCGRWAGNNQAARSCLPPNKHRGPSQLVVYRKPSMHVTGCWSRCLTGLCEHPCVSASGAGNELVSTVCGAASTRAA